MSFAFTEKNIELLKDNNVSDKITTDEVYDHETAKIIREFCRSTAAKIIIRVLPLLPIFHLDHLAIFFHYDFYLPDVDYTRRIYAVSIFMDKIRSLKLSNLNEENIRNYFEMENSQILGLFHRWKGRGIRMTEYNEMI